MTRPTMQYLARAYMADLITDARHAYKCARAVARGDTLHGMDGPAYVRYAEQAHAHYKKLRGATRYHIGTYGEVTAA